MENKLELDKRFKKRLAYLGKVFIHWKSELAKLGDPPSDLNREEVVTTSMSDVISQLKILRWVIGASNHAASE